MAKCNCWICGKEHDCCLKCKQMAGWKSIACSPDHYKAAIILREYDNGIINDKKAKSEFNYIGIKSEKDCTDFLDAVKKKVVKIISTEDTVERTNKKFTKTH